MVSLACFLSESAETHSLVAHDLFALELLVCQYHSDVIVCHWARICHYPLGVYLLISNRPLDAQKRNLSKSSVLEGRLGCWMEHAHNLELAFPNRDQKNRGYQLSHDNDFAVLETEK